MTPDPNTNTCSLQSVSRSSRSCLLVAQPSVSGYTTGMAESADHVVRDVLTVERSKFVATRRMRAAELRAGGRTGEADRVAALRKPSVALWAALVLARERPAMLDGLAEAIAGVRAALGGGGEPGAVQDELRARLRDVIGEARSLATDAGERVSDATAERIASILRASISSPDLLDQLRRGVLTDEPEPAGFASLEGLASGTRLTSRSASARRRSETAEARRRQREVKALERRLESARRTAEAARRRAKTAVNEAERAQAEVDAIEAELVSLRDGV
jgi:hypothetical protein